MDQQLMFKNKYCMIKMFKRPHIFRARRDSQKYKVFATLLANSFQIFIVSIEGFKGNSVEKCTTES